MGIGDELSNVNGHLLRVLKRVARRAKVKNATLHKMRRTYITRLIQSGVDIRTVMAFAGHSDLASTMRYMRPASASEMQTKIDSIFNARPSREDRASRVRSNTDVPNFV